MKQILFITTSSLAANPRLVKEVEALKGSYHCTVINFKHEDWSASLSEAIIKNHPEANFIQIDRKQSVMATVISKIVHRLAIALNPLFQQNLSIAAYASNDKTHQLLRVAKEVAKSKRFDRVIAHNLGAFYPAYQLASPKTVFQLDVEDYHPGELPYFNKQHETQNRELLIKTLLPKAHHVTYAAPLIQKACLNLCGKDGQLVAKSTVINNCFSQAEFQYQASASGKVKLVWFSQNIAKGRGLEDILPILNEFSEQVELHLIGNLYDNFKKTYLQNYKEFIVVRAPMPQQQLNLALSEYDVGLALETVSEDTNRQICLTNKIWAYLQSGLFIFATNTPAQIQFMASHPKHGLLAELNETTMRKQLKYIIKHIDSIRAEKKQRFNDAKTYAWEHEQNKLKQLIEL